MDSSMAQCRNCHAQLNGGEELCITCTRLPQCSRCKRRLAHRLFPSGSFVCATCMNRKPIVKAAIQGLLTEVSLPVSGEDMCFETFILSQQANIQEVLKEALRSHASLKVNARTRAHFTRVSTDGLTQSTEASFISKPVSITSVEDLVLKGIADDFSDQIENFNSRGSCWQLETILEFVLCLAPLFFATGRKTKALEAEEIQPTSSDTSNGLGKQPKRQHRAQVEWLSFLNRTSLYQPARTPGVVSHQHQK